jgi:integrase
VQTPAKVTLREAGDRLLEGMESGRVRDRSGRPYKPSTIRTYRRGLDRICDDLGSLRLAELRRADIKALVDRFHERGLSPSTIRNRIDPLRVVYREAMDEDLGITSNPTDRLRLPTARRKRDRIATAPEAAALIAALPRNERAAWATAFYAGLRRGELLAIRWTDVNLGRSEIRIHRAWDQYEGLIDTKSDTSERTVPILGLLRTLLAEHKLATGRRGEDLIFGREAAMPFVPSTLRSRALRAWEVAALPPIKLHEARHTFASLLIDSGANAKAIQEFMGHSTITETFDTYGHLMPGSRDEVRVRMDAYLDRSAAADA